MQNSFIKEPYIQSPKEDGVTVMWQTEKEARGQLSVWQAKASLCGDLIYYPQSKEFLFEGPLAQIHKIKAVGLKKDTDYCYQATSFRGGEKLKSPVKVFRTAPAANSSISFCVTSEFGGADASMQLMDKLVTQISKERPDFLLFVGDMVRDGRISLDWDKYIFIPFKRLFSTTPFYFCPGNHEENSSLMSLFLDMPPRGYHSFDYGCASFVALDSTQMATHKKVNGELAIVENAPLTHSPWLKPGDSSLSKERLPRQVLLLLR